MLERKDLLMAQLVGGMMLGIKATTDYLEETLDGKADEDRARELVRQNREWLVKVHEALNMDQIL